MPAGTRRNRVTIQTPGSAKGEYGEKSESWTDHATLYASILSANGREIVAAQAIGAEADTAIEIPYVAGVNASMRVTSDGKIYSIVAPPVDVDNRHRELRLICKTGVKAG